VIGPFVLMFCPLYLLKAVLNTGLPPEDNGALLAQVEGRPLNGRVCSAGRPPSIVHSSEVCPIPFHAFFFRSFQVLPLTPFAFSSLGELSMMGVFTRIFLR